MMTRQSKPQLILGVATALWLAPLSTPDASAAARELLFVANVDGSPVTAYPTLSSGPVSPAVSISNPNLPNTYWAPWGVAFDTQRNLYVQTFLSDATTFVFPPDDDGSGRLG